jgi:hypothetical protein
MNEMTSAIIIILLLLLELAGFIIGTLTIFKGRPFKFSRVAIIMIVTSLLGAVLVFLTFKQNIRDIFRIFLIMAGISPLAMLVSIILHNAFCALITKLSGKEFDEPVFFLIGLFVCPATFIVGIMGSLLLVIMFLILEISGAYS